MRAFHFIRRLEVRADAHPVHTYCLPVLGLVGAWLYIYVFM
jgi:hypothetical protein